jgi:biotin carboxylase
MAEVLVLVESNTTGTGRLFAERARDLGLVPHLLSADAGRYAYVAELDIPSRHCATGSVPAVLACCARLGAEHRVVGVTSSSEYFVPVAAAAARALGLPGEDPEPLAAARCKSTQRRRFAAHGVGSPGFRPVRSAAEAVLAADQLGMPVVVKPTNRSGSLGVRRCDTGREVAEHAAELLRGGADERGRPLPAEILVESYLAGPEFSVEVMDGDVRAVVAKHLDQSVGFLEVGHDVPADLDAGTRALLSDSALAALAALELRWGAAHVELRLTAGQPFVIEVNPAVGRRHDPAGDPGRDRSGPDRGLVARTAGRDPVRTPARRTCAAIRFLVPACDGVVLTVPDTSAAMALPGVVVAAVTARPGQRVVRQGTFLDRLGYVTATGPTQRQVGERAERAVSALPVEIVPDGVAPGGGPSDSTRKVRS